MVPPYKERVRRSAAGDGASTGLGEIRDNARVLSRALRQLVEQLPPTPLARAGAILYLVAGAIVAVLVPIFFAVMLWGVLTGQG